MCFALRCAAVSDGTPTEEKTFLAPNFDCRWRCPGELERLRTPASIVRADGASATVAPGQRWRVALANASSFSTTELSVYVNSATFTETGAAEAVVEVSASGIEPAAGVICAIPYRVTYMDTDLSREVANADRHLCLIPVQRYLCRTNITGRDCTR